MERLTQDFDEMRLRMHIPEHASLKNKFRWAVRDKKEFETLLQDLSHFTTELDALIPATGPSPILTQSDLQSIRDLQGLKIILEASLGLGRTAIANAIEGAIKEKRQQQILDMLWFRTMSAREEGITPAHAKTMDWALQPPRDGDEWDDLSAWLRSGKGIYWVSGKAGSGKSTLMKRLVQNSRTHDLLLEWAGGGAYILVNFFFWYHGTPEQQSQEGLSRSLLHQILSQRPSAIPEVLPGMWKELEHNPKAKVSLPNPTETRHAFQTLASKASEFGRFCVFIDGLDEFTGDFRDAITFIQDLTANPCFKVVVSSRPIPECNAGFEDCPGLRLQDLTRPDIAKYVDDVIGGHKSMQRLLTQHPPEARQLRDELVDKSSGVFLWVVLACRSLLSGFAHGDQLADLQRRVAELPPELGDMFTLMLSRIDKRYREQGAFMLRVCYGLSSIPRGDKLRKFITEQPMTLGLVLLTQGGNCERNDDRFRPRSKTEQRELCEEFGGWLTSRCGGLLELQLASRDDDRPRLMCLCRHARPHDPSIDSSVRWMHRTVFEFLQDRKVWESEVLQCHKSRPSRAGALSLYGLYLGIHIPPLFRIDIGTYLHPEWDAHLIFSGMLAARADAEDPADRTAAVVLRGLHQELVALRAMGGDKLPVDLDLHPSNCDHLAALILAAQFGAFNYLKASLQPGDVRQAGTSPKGLSTLLAAAVLRPMFFEAHRDQNKMGTPSKPVIDWLLASGADPNTRVGSGDDEGGVKTIWASWVDGVMSWYPIGSADTPDVAEITVMLLVAGADPKLADQLPPQIRQCILMKFNREKTGPAKDALRTAVMIIQGRTTLLSGPDINSAGLDDLTVGRRDSDRSEATGDVDEPGTIVVAAEPGHEIIPALTLTRPQKRGRSVPPGDGEISPPGKRTNNRP